MFGVFSIILLSSSCVNNFSRNQMYNSPNSKYNPPSESTAKTINTFSGRFTNLVTNGEELNSLGGLVNTEENCFLEYLKNNTIDLPGGILKLECDENPTNPRNWEAILTEPEGNERILHVAFKGNRNLSIECLPRWFQNHTHINIDKSNPSESYVHFGPQLLGGCYKCGLSNCSTPSSCTNPSQNLTVSNLSNMTLDTVVSAFNSLQLNSSDKVSLVRMMYDDYKEQKIKKEDELQKSLIIRFSKYNRDMSPSSCGGYYHLSSNISVSSYYSKIDLNLEFICWLKGKGKAKLKFAFKDSIGGIVHNYITPYVYLERLKDKTVDFTIYLNSQKAIAIKDVQITKAF